MSNNKKNEKEGLFKGVMMAYTVLVLHVLLIGGLGLLVFFLRGLVQYMVWIFAGGLVMISASAYYFYRRMKQEGKNLKEMIRAPLLAGKSVEVSLLGGMASFKVGPADGPNGSPQLENSNGDTYPLLEDPAATEIRELKELARLYGDGLITREEYAKAKQQLLKLS